MKVFSRGPFGVDAREASKLRFLYPTVSVLRFLDEVDTREKYAEGSDRTGESDDGTDLRHAPSQFTNDAGQRRSRMDG